MQRPAKLQNVYNSTSTCCDGSWFSLVLWLTVTSTYRKHLYLNNNSNFKRQGWKARKQWLIQNNKCEKKYRMLSNYTYLLVQSLLTRSWKQYLSMNYWQFFNHWLCLGFVYGGDFKEALGASYRGIFFKNCPHFNWHPITHFLFSMCSTSVIITLCKNSD